MKNPDVISAPDTGAPEWAWTELEAGPLAPGEADRRYQDEIEQAYRSGFSDGQDAGATRARGELKAVMSATLEALEEVRSNRVEWGARLKEDVTVLAGAMARHIVDRALEEDPEIFADLARKAVACFHVDEPVRIRLHPDDMAQLHESGTASEFMESRSVRWIQDEDVVRGGCVVEGPDKIVDGRVDEGLLRLIRTINSA